MNYLKLTRLLFEGICKESFFGGPMQKEREAVNKKLNDEGKDYFPYIPIDDQRIGLIIEDIMSTNPSLEDKSFMDIGCGVPIIPKIFDVLGCKKSVGLEYQEEYVKKDHEGFLIQGDLLTYGFGDYDYLYSYNPIRDGKLMSKGLQNIMDTMKPGAIFYFVQACSIDPKVMEKFTRATKGYSTYKFVK